MSGRRDPERYDIDRWKALQKIVVVDRSGGRCEFEVAVPGLTPGETHYAGQRISWEADIAWVRCNGPAQGPGSGLCHIFRRWKNGMHPTDDGPPLKFHAYAVLAGCGLCHRRFDVDDRGLEHRVRVPALARTKAKLIIEHTLEAARSRGEAGIDPGLAHV